ncbi:MAG: hypothetical protein HYT94_01200 [Parcubacteria group bacterium]|nr:hypothetical protein [Parcubacteria group bacterium]
MAKKEIQKEHIVSSPAEKNGRRDFHFPQQGRVRGNLGNYLKAMHIPITRYVSKDFEVLPVKNLGDVLGQINEGGACPRYLVVETKKDYWVLDKMHARFRDQILHIIAGSGQEKVPFALEVKAGISASEAFARAIKEKARSIVLLDEKGVVGVVPPKELIKLSPAFLAGLDVSEKEINTGTSDTPERQYNAVPRDDCKCAIILFEKIAGIPGTPIDGLTGGFGYSHAAIDCCEKDAETGEPLMIDITLSNGVHRTPLSTDKYNGRKRMRIELSAEDCEEICNCMKRKVGATFDWTDFWKEDGEGDPDGTVCSQTIFECLPPHLQDKIREAGNNMDLGFWGKLNKSHNPGLVSPNQIAQAFGAPKAGDIVGSETTVPATPPTQPSTPMVPAALPRRCHVKVRVIRVKFKPGTDQIGTDWKFQFDVNGRGSSDLPNSDFSKSTEPLTPRKLIFNENRGSCGDEVEINVIVKAWQYDGVNDYGYTETDTPWKFRCPGQGIRDMELTITDWNDICILQFRFEVELVCE